MNTVRIALRWLGMSLLAVLLLAPPASAQKVVQKIVKTDTSDTDKKTIVIEIEDGDRRVIVDGKELSDEEAEAFLEEENVRMGGEGERHVIRMGPMRDRLRISGRAPEVLARAHRFEGPRAFFFDEDGFREGMVRDLEILGDDFTWFPGEGGALAGEMHMSMKARSEIAKMDMESRRLARQVREAEGAERELLEQELRTRLDEIFERKQALRAEHVEQLRRQLEAVQTEHGERQEAKREIIERRLKKLLGQDDKYDW